MEENESELKKDLKRLQICVDELEQERKEQADEKSKLSVEY